MAKRARRDGCTDIAAACETCDFFGCTCGLRGPAGTGGDDRRVLVDHLCRVSSDLVSVADELQKKLQFKKCCVCGEETRHDWSCDCPENGVATNHTVADELRRLAREFEAALDQGKQLLGSGYDKRKPDENGVAVSHDDGGSDSVSSAEEDASDFGWKRNWLGCSTLRLVRRLNCPQMCRCSPPVGPTPDPHDAQRLLCCV